MRLRRITIKNLRSLEDATLDGLDQFNVLIGHNNAGKSTIVEAFAAVGTALTGKDFPSRLRSETWRTAVTGLDVTRHLRIELVGTPDRNEREQFIEAVAGGLSPTRMQRLRDSSFASAVSIALALDPSPVQPIFQLAEARIRGEIGEDESWPLVAAPTPSAGDRADFTHMQNIGRFLWDDPERRVDSSWFGMERIGIGGTGTKLVPKALAEYSLPNDSGAWPIVLLRRYFQRSFFFDPYRRSQELVEVRPEEHLASDGNNLAQVLNTARTNDEDRYEWVQGFVDGALPGVGRLMTPQVRGQNYTMTKVEFRPPAGGHSLALHSMGSGVEQLLFAATVLSEPWLTGLVVLEEPESHLHPTAQRSLIAQLHQSQGQVLVTTHSPLFVDQSQPKRVFRVALVGGRTTTEFAGEPEQLGEALAGIGFRNSDVLLADAVLFVEDKRDYEVFKAWATSLGTPLRDHGVAVISTRGAEYAARHAPMRSDVLVRISEQARIIPHMFVIDHDERSEAEIQSLRGKLSDGRLHVFQRRELENYLLAPRAILAGMRSKYFDKPIELARIDASDEKELQRRIEAEAAELRGLVLLKRLRVRLGGPGEGFLWRKDAEQLSEHAWDPDLSGRLTQRIEDRFGRELAKIDIAQLVEEERARLEVDWVGPDAHIKLAPGEEILKKVCSSLGNGIGFNKNDVTLIAQEMTRDEIPRELRDLIGRIVELASSQA